jgi:hypothetical protein
MRDSEVGPTLPRLAPLPLKSAAPVLTDRFACIFSTALFRFVVEQRPEEVAVRFGEARVLEPEIGAPRPML